MQVVTAMPLLFERGLEGVVEGSAGGVVAAVPVDGFGFTRGREFREGVCGGAAQDRQSTAVFGERRVEGFQRAVQPPAGGCAGGTGCVGFRAVSA